MQNGKKIPNYEAGVDLFNLIYNEFQMSCKAIIFTSDMTRARQAIESRGINSKNWKVVTDDYNFKEQVRKEFERIC